MEPNPNFNPTAAETASASKPALSPEETARLNRIRLAIVIGGIVFALALLGAIVYFLLLPSTPTATIRDIFIIFMAMISLVIGVALVILIVQVAILINLLQNEIKPILNSTNDTVNTLRGTATFLSNNLAEPVIKLNEYLAAIKRLVDILHIGKK